ncbi:hypothetical protein CU666_29905 [Pseudomonas syringae pv. actinidifoliorum]|nr:hypothetical protein [Pseudomonas syringae pv. actinidifoliorum]
MCELTGAAIRTAHEWPVGRPKVYADVSPLSRASSLPQGNVYSDVGVSLLTKRPAWLPMIYAQRESAFASKLPTGAELV